jgi:hypothetical protein
MGTSPGMVVAASEGGDSDVGLLRDRPPIDGSPTAYVCRGFVCDRPITDLSEFAARLRAARE